jgi:hypothetical protein
MGYAEAASEPKSANVSIRHQVDEMLSEALNLESRLSKLMERIEGPRPAQVFPGKPGSTEAQPALSHSVRRLREALDRCHSEVGQIEDRV